MDNSRHFSCRLVAVRPQGQLRLGNVAWVGQDVHPRNGYVALVCTTSNKSAQLLTVERLGRDMTDSLPEHVADYLPTPTTREALHTTLSMPFEEAVDRVQLEHEFAGFETVKVTRLDQMVEGALQEDVPPTALIVMCHAEIAYTALTIDPTLAGLLPCTTVVYRDEDDSRTAHVYHVSATKALRDLGFGIDEGEAVQELVELTGDRMDDVWENVESLTALEYDWDQGEFVNLPE